MAVSRTEAERIVDAIIRDLSDRSGIGDEWHQIDEDLQAEVRDTWIELAMNGGE
jgi:hypothetical protein